MSTVPPQANPMSAAKPVPVPVRVAAAAQPNPAPANAPAAATANPADEGLEESGFMAAMKSWALNEAPPMLISTIVHTVLFLALALTLGNAVMESPKDKGPEFTASENDNAEVPQLERFELGDPQYEPSELDTDSLMMA